MVTILAIVTQIPCVTFRTVCANNSFSNLNAAGAKHTGTRLAIIFISYSWVSIEAIFTFLTVVTHSVVLTAANPCHWIARVWVTITLTWNTPGRGKNFSKEKKRTNSSELLGTKKSSQCSLFWCYSLLIKNQTVQNQILNKLWPLAIRKLKFANFKVLISIQELSYWCFLHVSFYVVFSF